MSKVNARAFACLDCNLRIDSGYRWCYWTLEEPGIIHLGKPVDVPSVLACEAYWETASEGPSPGGWLETLLPKVRCFLQEHRDHRMLFGDVVHDFWEFEDVSP